MRLYIRTSEGGNIELISAIQNTECDKYIGDVPDDFLNTVGLGKYKFLNGQIVEVEGWVMPEIKLIF